MSLVQSHLVQFKYPSKKTLTLLAIFVTIASVAGGVISPLWAAISAIIVLSIFGILFFSSRYYIDDIEITCLQESLRNSAKNQHENIYNVKNGMGKLEMYVKVPEYRSGVDIEIDADGAFEIGAIPKHDKNPKPSAVSYENRRLFCDKGLTEFTVVLKISGDAEELGSGRYLMEFVDNPTGNIIHSINIVTSPHLPAESREELDTEEAKEWGLDENIPA